MQLQERQTKVMIKRRRWFDRQFELGLPLAALPDILERLRGTPARLEERVASVPSEVLVRRVDNKWSIQENVGHLLDLEPLWAGRLDDLLGGSNELRPADLQNRRTDEARHNKRRLEELLSEFRAARMSTVARLEGVSETQLRQTALHPRLEQPMTAVDLVFFVAEHDDHHLARVAEILAQSTVAHG